MSERSAHRVVRPLWMCAVDGLPWPCVPARELLHDVHADDLGMLQRHMARLMAVAEQEIGVLDRPALYRRFVAWTLDDGQRCAVCGILRHAVIPGLPPRLVPCNDVRHVVGEVQAIPADGL